LLIVCADRPVSILIITSFCCAIALRQSKEASDENIFFIFLSLIRVGRNFQLYLLFVKLHHVVNELE
jgi:hypothetical protein